MTLQMVQVDSYDRKFWLTIVVLLIALSLTTYQLMQNFYTKNMMLFSSNDKALYLFVPDALEHTQKRLGIDPAEYRKTLDKFIALNQRLDFKISKISDLKLIEDDGILILMDTLSLSDQERMAINRYVDKGGNLLFNSQSGFRDDDFKLRGDSFIHNITGLKLSASPNHIKLKDSVMTVRLLSPMGTYIPNGDAVYLLDYDPLPVFETPRQLKADAYLTNQAQNSFLKINDEYLPKSQSGLLWHGTKNLGKWVYFSFPLYSMFESTADLKHFENLYKGMIEYLTETFILRKLPYLDSDNVSFVSQDTEYQYQSFEQFSDVSRRYRVPVTAFCVADLTEQHKDLVDKIKDNSYMDFGSHSYDHKQIVGTSDENYRLESAGSRELLSKLTGRTITGFRPPREEIDTKLLTLLAESGYHYVLNKIEDRIYPYFRDGMMIIPRHATDDYAYLIEMDWGPKEIVDHMIRENRVQKALDGIYALSTHTHLMNYSTNIQILDAYFDYLSKNPQIKSMSGEMLYDRITKTKAVVLNHKESAVNLLVNIENSEDVQIDDFTFRVFTPHKKIVSIESEMIGLEYTFKRIDDFVYDVVVKKLAPGSKNLLFIKYEEL